VTVLIGGKISPSKFPPHRQTSFKACLEALLCFLFFPKMEGLQESFFTIKARE
jgi:hypothetical protein